MSNICKWEDWSRQSLNPIYLTSSTEIELSRSICSWPFKLGRLITRNTSTAFQNLIPTHSFPLFTTWFYYLGDCKLGKKKHSQGHKLDLTCDYWIKRTKVTSKAFNIRGIWNPVCFHGGKILRQRIKHFSYKLVGISFSIIFDQNSVEFMTSSLR